MTKTNTIVEERTEERRNRFNGESIMLTKEDERLGTGGSKHWQEMRNLLDWFMKHNAKAYMVLLD